MDCKHIQKNEIHEKYLLNRLTEAEKAEYEKHIEECSPCREELNKQSKIIQGIREIGLQEMKYDIRQQVEEVRSEKKSVDWQMILKVAAVLFIIAIIPSAIYYFQTESGKPVSQLLKSEPSTSSSETFSFDKNQVNDESKTNEKTPLSSKSTASLEKPVNREKQDKAEILGEDRLKNSSDVVYGRAEQGYAAAEAKSIEEIPDSDSILEKEEAEVTQSQTFIAAKQKKDSLSQKLSAGITYHYVKSDVVNKKAALFKTQEITTAQQYDAVTSKKLAPETSLMEKSTGRDDNKSTITSGAVYETGEKQITINFLSAERKLMIDQESKLPQSFDVQIIVRDSSDWKMNLFVNKEFLQYDLNRIKLVINKTKIYLIILNDYIYEIDASEDSTKAVLIK